MLLTSSGNVVQYVYTQQAGRGITQSLEEKTHHDMQLQASLQCVEMSSVRSAAVLLYG